MSRFVRFNVVGVAGFLVQLTALVTLEALGVPLVLATCLAVEAAVLHNFAWHERWTWRNATAGGCAGRLVRFQVSNGLISLAGNTAITAALVSAGAPLTAAAVVAVLACAVLNFVAAEAFVFCTRAWPVFHGHLH